MPRSKKLKGHCPICGSDLVLRKGVFGLFAGCSRFPDCSHTQTLSTIQHVSVEVETKPDIGYYDYIEEDGFTAR